MWKAVILGFLAVASGAMAAMAQQSPVPGWSASTTFVDGDPPEILVAVRHVSVRDRVTAIELRAPDGRNILAHVLETEVVTERVAGPGYGGPTIGIGIGGGYGGYSGGGHVGGGIGFGFGIPLGGYPEETVASEIRSEGSIVVPWAENYRINWSFYRIRITVTRDDGTVQVAVLEAPRP